MTMIYLILCLLLASQAAATASESNHLFLDEKTLERCLHDRSGEPDGLLIFRVFDSEGRLRNDSVAVRWMASDGTYSRPVRNWQADWANSLYRHPVVELSGHQTVVLDSSRIPSDLALLVTLRMRSGVGTITSQPTVDSLVKIDTLTLDGVFPKNEIVGTIFDDATGEPVANASVYCEERNQTVSTDSVGKFTIGLGLLRSVEVNAWHPQYDSVRFMVEKKHLRTFKEVELHFQAQRRAEDEEPTYWPGDSTILLLVDLMRWSSWGVQPHETANKIFVYAARPGDLFGPTVGWAHYDCIPFRLIKEIDDSTAWIQFTRALGIAGQSMNSRTNHLFLTDTAAQLNTRGFDGGTIVTLSLQPDYSPRGQSKKNGNRRQKSRAELGVDTEIDTCDVIRAEVERAHLRTVLAVLDRDIDRYAECFSATFVKRTPEPAREPARTREGDILMQGPPEHARTVLGTIEDFGRAMRADEFDDRRLNELFRLSGEEIYIHGLCQEPANERFVAGCEKNEFVPKEGDVYIYWPGVGGPWEGGWGALYRKEESVWKIAGLF